MRIKLYVEGGGDGPALKTSCRRGFRELIARAGLNGCMPRIIACGTRRQAYEDFCRAIENAGDDEFVCLLVDSEDPVTGQSPWMFLAGRPGDKWDRPSKAAGENVHLMVQCMESWFLADRAALERFFGKGFRRSALPNRPDLESIGKKELFQALENATRECEPKGAYRKGKHSFDILAVLDPELLCRSSRHAQRFFETLRQKV